MIKAEHVAFKCVHTNLKEHYELHDDLHVNQYNHKHHNH